MLKKSATTTISRLNRIASLARWGTLLLILVMFAVTHLPLVDPLWISLFSLEDKILHDCGYMALAISVLTSWELSTGILQPPHYFMAWLSGTLYGLFDEVTQIPVVAHAMDWIGSVRFLASFLV